MPEPYSELASDIVCKILDAVEREMLALAATDAPLEEVFANGDAAPRVYSCESIPVALDDSAITTDVPALLIAPGAITETRLGNAGYTELKTTVEFGLLTKVAGSTDHQGWLRPRILRQIKLRLMREKGTLRDGTGLPSDNPLTDALQGFGRTEASGRLKKANSVLLTMFRATFTSPIDEATGNFLE